MGRKGKQQEPAGSRKGAAGFDRYYRKLYGEEWDALLEALREEAVPAPLAEGVVKPYFMDRASMETARALGALPGETVLDMCAAPGGKSLVIAAMMGGKGRLICNDRSAGRRARLRRVLEEHLAAPFREPVEVTSHDATRWGLYEQEVYDRILLDAPCSSERHLVSDPKYLDAWSPGRGRRLSAQAFAMAAAALDALKKGGILLYSTCTINDDENDGVMEKLFKRRDGMAELVQPETALGRPTRFGRLILPHRDGGLGPMYLALVRKIGTDLSVHHEGTRR